jgi:hypothetical protein
MWVKLRMYKSQITFLLPTVAERDKVLNKLSEFLASLPSEAESVTELIRRSSSVDGNSVVTVRETVTFPL